MADAEDDLENADEINEIDSLLDPDADPNPKTLFGFKPLYVYAAGGGAASVFLGLIATIVVLLISGGGSDGDYVDAALDGAEAGNAAPAGVDVPALGAAPALWALPREAPGESASRACQGLGLILADGRTQFCVEFDAVVTHPDLLPLTETGPQLESPLRTALDTRIAPRIREMNRAELLGAQGPERIRLVLLEEINAAIAPFYFDDILIHRFELT